MKRIVEIIEYVAKAFSAIATGFRAASDNWPTNSPFKKDESEQATKE